MQETKPPPYYEGETAMKKEKNVISNFKGLCFRGAFEYSVRHLIRHFNQFAKQFSLPMEEKDTFFLSTLEAPARDLFFDNGNSRITYEEMT